MLDKFGNTIFFSQYLDELNKGCKCKNSSNDPIQILLAIGNFVHHPSATKYKNTVASQRSNTNANYVKIIIAVIGFQHFLSNNTVLQPNQKGICTGLMAHINMPKKKRCILFSSNMFFASALPLVAATKLPIANAMMMASVIHSITFINFCCFRTHAIPTNDRRTYAISTNKDPNENHKAFCRLSCMPICMAAILSVPNGREPKKLTNMPVKKNNG